MLIPHHDAYENALDFSHAQVDDSFWRVEHVPYSRTVRGMTPFRVIEVTEKWIRSEGPHGKVWRFKRGARQADCYVENDPCFLDIRTHFERHHRVAEAKRLVRERDSRDFDPEVIAAILAWGERLRGS